MITARITAVILERLNLWFLELSKSIVVETCKKIPITIAVIGVSY